MKTWVVLLTVCALPAFGSISTTFDKRIKTGFEVGNGRRLVNPDGGYAVDVFDTWTVELADAYTKLSTGGGTIEIDVVADEESNSVPSIVRSILPDGVELVVFRFLKQTGEVVLLKARGTRVAIQQAYQIAERIEVE